MPNKQLTTQNNKITKTETLEIKEAMVKRILPRKKKVVMWYFTRVKGIAGIDIERFGSYSKDVAHKRYLNFISKLENN